MTTERAIEAGTKEDIVGRRLMTAAIAAALLLAAALPAAATHRPRQEHLEGDEPVSQALAWSAWSSAKDTREDVVLGRSDSFPDSLASGMLQGKLAAPLLLTPGNVLDPRVRVELTRLEAKTIHILGGESAISPTVEQALVAQGYTVKRYAGSSRVGTALAVAKEHTDFNEGAEREAVLARAFGDGSSGFADALGAGALSAQWALPMLLTPSNSLDDSVAKFLRDEEIERVHLAGGTAALSAAVEAQLEAMGIEPVRIAGPDRAATAVAMNGPRRIDAPDVTTVILTEGYADAAWASGFAAAFPAVRPYRNADGSTPQGVGPEWKPVVLAQGSGLPAATTTFLQSLPDDARLLCAPGVVRAACDLAQEYIAS